MYLFRVFSVEGKGVVTKCLIDQKKGFPVSVKYFKLTRVEKMGFGNYVCRPCSPVQPKPVESNFNQTLACFG